MPLQKSQLSQHLQLKHQHQKLQLQWTTASTTTSSKPSTNSQWWWNTTHTTKTWVWIWSILATKCLNNPKFSNIKISCNTTNATKWTYNKFLHSLREHPLYHNRLRLVLSLNPSLENRALRLDHNCKICIKILD